MTPAGSWQTPMPPLPDFPVELSPPDLRPYLTGNTGIAGVWSRAGESAGPHVVVTALIHGNEIAGAAVLVELLRAPPRLFRGRLTLIFANLDAYALFDPGQPTASRYAEEDMNRLWEVPVLEGARQSLELTRARVLRPVVEAADVLLDLHSMLWPGDPLILCGMAERGRALAVRLGEPGLVVADGGHAAGRRLIDYAPFVAPDGARTAVLVEAGQHWLAGTPAAMRACVDRLMGVAGLGAAVGPVTPPRVAEVTHAITAATGGFSFVRPFRGGDVVKRARTLIATDGGHEIRTPYDDCVLVMPSLRPSRGHTAVRLARVVAG